MHIVMVFLNFSSQRRYTNGGYTSTTFLFFLFPLPFPLCPFQWVLSNDFIQFMLWFQLTFLLTSALDLVYLVLSQRHGMVNQKTLSWFLFYFHFCSHHLDWSHDFISSFITMPIQNYWRSRVFATWFYPLEQEKSLRRRLSREYQFILQYLCNYKCNNEY